MIDHPINPVYDSESKILILGSFPSVKSREQGFFYGHVQNRFWSVLAFVFECEVPRTIEEKTAFLLENHIALWDVIKSCDITGSSDSSIKNVVPNDISFIIDNSKVNKIFTNGKKADMLYQKYIESSVKIKAICLPSTSPANAAWSTENLCEYWKSKLKD
ncbi:MAG: DNA-deoxyinosine glycosylase [Clostridiales bacterium]|nr:DNA-deoxyinosine glycosylase [Clostridiales bacterium]